MTAKDIQIVIIKDYQEKDICLPNFFYHFWECDIFRLQRNGFIIEYEVKMTKSDFYADFKKVQGSIEKHNHILSGKRCNRFYFVIPEGIIKEEEVPHYCGLITFDGHRLNVVRNAKLLSKEKVGYEYYQTLAEKLFYRLRDAKLHYPK